MASTILEQVLENLANGARLPLELTATRSSHAETEAERRIAAELGIATRSHAAKPSPIRSLTPVHHTPLEPSLAAAEPSQRYRSESSDSKEQPGASSVCELEVSQTSDDSREHLPGLSEIAANCALILVQIRELVQQITELRQLTVQAARAQTPQARPNDEVLARILDLSRQLSSLTSVAAPSQPASSEIPQLEARAPKQERIAIGDIAGMIDAIRR